jgi:hypothetical protein
VSTSLEVAVKGAVRTRSEVICSGQPSVRGASRSLPPRGLDWQASPSVVAPAPSAMTARSWMPLAAARSASCPTHAFGRPRRSLGCDCAHPRRRCNSHHSAQRTGGDRPDRTGTAAQGSSRECQARAAQRRSLTLRSHSTTLSADGKSVPRSRLSVSSGANATVTMPACVEDRQLGIVGRGVDQAGLLAPPPGQASMTYAAVAQLFSPSGVD